MNAMFIGLLVQEVKHVLDGQGQGGAPVCRAEDGLKEIVHKLLQRALGRQDRFRHSSTLGANGGFIKLSQRPGEWKTGTARPAGVGTHMPVSNLPQPLHLSLNSFTFPLHVENRCTTDDWT